MFLGSFESDFSYSAKRPSEPPTKKDLPLFGRYNKVSIEKFYPGLVYNMDLNSPLIAKYNRSPLSVPIIRPSLRIQYDVKLKSF